MSNLRLYRSLLPAYQMADYDWESVTAAVRSNFAVMTRQYMSDRESIPKGNLVEVRFEDIERDPLAQLERIYLELELPGWEQARAPIATYLEKLSGYQKNRHRVDRSIIEIVNRDWGFAVKEWAYTPPRAGDSRGAEWTLTRRVRASRRSS